MAKMIQQLNDELVFSFPDLHVDAILRVSFQRTLRTPDDGRKYGLPAGLGRFPLRNVDDLQDPPPAWTAHGGVALPMYASEALWISFSSPRGYPFAVKVAAGKVNAVTGKPWDTGLADAPQNYVPVPPQPWLDGFAVGNGVVRQFVAMPLGAGYSVEEQVTGAAEHGGIQVQVFPLNPELYRPLPPPPAPAYAAAPMAAAPPSARMARPAADMGLAMGGRIEQQIFTSAHGLRDWEPDVHARCFVHLVNALVWRALAGTEAPPTPVTQAEYRRRGIPWFSYYDEGARAEAGSEILAGVRSVAELGAAKGDVPLPDNASMEMTPVVTIKPYPGQVREGGF
jgi:hypothetical protein